MTRILAFAAAAIALLAWLNLRDLLRRPEPMQPDPADDVQPADPVTVHQVWPGAQWIPSSGYGTGDFWPQPWVNTSTSPNTGYRTDPVVSTLEPLSERDRDWLDQTVRASLYPST